MHEDKKQITIGRAEKVTLLDYGRIRVIAKVDTGADISSIWASKVGEENGELSFRLFGPSSPYYTGAVITLKGREYSLTRIANSFGHREERYVVKMRIKLAGRLVNATFTLADRRSKTYPVLLGRRLLKGKFTVDVGSGKPLLHKERLKKANMSRDLKSRRGKV